MELKQIYELWDRFEASCVRDLELEYQGVHLHLKKGMNLSPAEAGNAVLTSTPQVAVSPMEQALDTKEKKELAAPVAGTFYRAPSAEEKPFVEVGQSVKKGDIIGIIEAMKLMNEVVATEDGVVSEILAANQSFVEYNQVLMKLI